MLYEMFRKARMLKRADEHICLVVTGQNLAAFLNHPDLQVATTWPLDEEASTVCGEGQIQQVASRCCEADVLFEHGLLLRRRRRRSSVPDAEGRSGNEASVSAAAKPIAASPRMSCE